MPEATERLPIFLVEDEALVAHDVQQRLEAVGHTVSGIATSGEEALLVLPTTDRSLILMDINLGRGLDGIEVASRVRGQLQSPIVFLTAYSTNEFFERAKATEPFGYIVKPFTSITLEVSVALAQQRYALERKLQSRDRNEPGLQDKSRGGEEGLLRSLEMLLCSPRLLDLELGYDHKAREFYAGCETGKNLRELLGTILLQHSTQLNRRVN